MRAGIGAESGWGISTASPAPPQRSFLLVIGNRAGYARFIPHGVARAGRRAGAAGTRPCRSRALKRLLALPSPARVMCLSGRFDISARNLPHAVCNYRTLAPLGAGRSACRSLRLPGLDRVGGTLAARPAARLLVEGGLLRACVPRGARRGKLAHSHRHARGATWRRKKSRRPRRRGIASDALQQLFRRARVVRGR